ncbi:MAG: beta strand repeat-containing protein [Stenotrophobium sp.]
MKTTVLKGLAAIALASLALSACSTADNGNGLSGNGALPTIGSFNLTPTVVQPGGTATLTWATANATACAASGDPSNGNWTGAQPTSNAAGTTIGPYTQSGTYSYVLTCTGPGGSASAVQTLMVGAVAAPTVSLVPGSALIQPGSATTLTLSSTNSTACTGSDNSPVTPDQFAGSQPPNTTTTVSTGNLPQGSYTYTLTCTGPGGTGSAATTITSSSSAPPSVSFNTPSQKIQPGNTATFSWTTVGATSCTASGGNWSGAQSTSGSFTTPVLTTPGTYTYLLSCTNSGGTTTGQTQVIVNNNGLPTVQITVAPTQIATGASANLTWTTTNATACTASGSWSGSEPLNGSGVSTGALTTPGIYSYTLTCTGASGSASNSAQLQVGGATNVGPSISFIANPNPVAQGQSTALIWSTTDHNGTVSSCNASGGDWANTAGFPPSNPVSGNVPFTGTATPGTYNFALTCTDGTYTSTSTIALVVTPAAANGPHISLTAAPSSLGAPGATTLTWSSTDATACTASSNPAVAAWTTGASSATSGSVANVPLAAPGDYNFVLTCTGALGAVSRRGVIVPVASGTTVPVAALNANPNLIQVVPGNPQSSTLTWSSANATACLASGSWSGLQGTSGSASTGTLTSPGQYNYVLTCSGAGGTAYTQTAVTVTGAPPAPTVTFIPATKKVAPGSPFALNWATTDAATCTATGGDGTTDWVAGTAEPINGPSPATTPPSTFPVVPGIYTYGLNCTGPGGSSGNVTTTLTVSSGPDCGLVVNSVATPSTALVTPGYTASGATSGTCLLCAVTNTGDVIDADLTNFATMSVPVGLINPVATITVNPLLPTMPTFPAGRAVAFEVATPAALLTAGVLQTVSINTLLGGVVQETSTTTTNLKLDAAGLLAAPGAGFLDFVTTKPFDGLQINYGGTVTALGTLNVYDACVSLK